MATLQNQLSRAHAATAYCLKNNNEHVDEIDDRDRTIKRQRNKTLALEMEIIRLIAVQVRNQGYLEQYRQIVEGVNQDRETTGLPNILAIGSRVSYGLVFK